MGIMMKKWASLKKKKHQQEDKEQQVTAKETQIWRRLRRHLFTTSSSSSGKWKRVEILQIEIVDGLVYKVMYVVEAVVLVSTLCFFYLCCGCHF